MQITYPFAYFPSNWNILAFFTTFRFCSFHLILFLWTLNSFMWIYSYKRKKKIEETLCLQPRWYICISFHLHLYANSPSFFCRFHWRQKCHLWFLRCLPFWAPCLFWLSRLWEKVMRNTITEQSHATRFKTADLDISGILCSTVVSKTIKCFTKFHLQIIEDIWSTEKFAFTRDTFQ